MKGAKVVDYVLVFGAIYLLTILLLIPEIPLLNKLLYASSGLRLFVLVAELLFSAYVIFFSVSGNGGSEPKSKAYLWLIALWLGWAVASAMKSQHEAAALFRVTETVSSVVFLYAVWLFVRRYNEIPLLIRNCLIIGFFIYSLFLLTGWVLFEPWVLTPNYEKLFVGFGNIRHFGYYALIALVVSLGLLWRALYNNYSLLALIYFLCAIASWTWLFAIAGRGPFFAIFVSTVVTFFVNKGYFNKRFIVALFVSSVIGLIVSIPVSPESYGPSRLLNKAIHSETLNEFSTSRLSIWQDSFKVVLEHPFFGVGPDGYLFELGYKYPGTAHPHGIFSQITLEWGIPGALLFLIIVFTAAINVSIKVSKLREGKRDLVGLYWVIMSIAVFSTVDGILYFPRTVLIFLVMLALLLGDLGIQPIKGSCRSCRYVISVILFASIIVSVLHANSLISVASGPVAKIDDQRIHNIQFFPSVMADAAVVGTLANWGRTWSNEVATESLLDWYQWAERNSIRPWIFVYLHAELLFENDRSNEAIELLSHYKERSPGNFQDKFECLQSRYLSPKTKI